MYTWRYRFSHNDAYIRFDGLCITCTVCVLVERLFVSYGVPQYAAVPLSLFFWLLSGSFNLLALMRIVRPENGPFFVARPQHYSTVCVCATKAAAPMVLWDLKVFPPPTAAAAAANVLEVCARQ